MVAKPQKSTAELSKPQIHAFTTMATMGDNVAINKFLDQCPQAINMRDLDNQSALTRALYAGRRDTVRLLIERGADVNSKGGWGRTDLYQFAATGRWEAVELLLENGAKVDAKDDKDSTPLMLACAFRNVDATSVLIEKGADVNARNKFGETPLMLAALNGDILIVEKLLKAGASLDTKDENGSTALMYAAKNGYWKTADMLMKNGAFVYEKNSAGKTAQQIAEEHNRQWAAEQLEPWYEIQKPRMLKQQEEEHQQWVKDTDCNRGLEKDMAAPRKIKLKRPGP